MHAFLIVHGTPEQRLERIRSLVEEWKTAAFDVHALELGDSLSIGIAQVRSFQSSLLLKPVSSPFAVGTIPDAHKLTPEAQNALLKTLEEPPGDTRIILSAPDTSSVLPTVVSRCQIMPVARRAGQEDDGETAKTLDMLLDPETSYGAIVLTVDAITANRENAKAWIEAAIPMLERRLDGDRTDREKTARALRALLDAYGKLSSNVNPKLALDGAFFAVKTSGQTPVK